MRWIWIDTFVEFVSGQRAAAIKNVTLAEEYLQDHFPGFPVMPPTLMIEGMAQTAGILVGEARGFSENVILAKVKRARFDGYAYPGDQIRYNAVVESIDTRAAVTSGTMYTNGNQIGIVDLMFSHVNPADSPIEMPDHFVFTDQFMELLADFRTSKRNGNEPSHGN